MDAVICVKQLFETLSRESVARIREVYAPDVKFKDPFNDVHGLGAFERVFAHMFEQVAAPRFVIAEAAAQRISASRPTAGCARTRLLGCVRRTV